MSDGIYIAVLLMKTDPEGWPISARVTLTGNRIVSNERVAFVEISLTSTLFYVPAESVRRSDGQPYPFDTLPSAVEIDREFNDHVREMDRRHHENDFVH